MAQLIWRLTWEVSLIFRWQSITNSPDHSYDRIVDNLRSTRVPQMSTDILRWIGSACDSTEGLESYAKRIGFMIRVLKIVRVDSKQKRGSISPTELSANSREVISRKIAALESSPIKQLKQQWRDLHKKRTAQNPDFD